eukprot:CAMPEP_0184494016 /NCGR_PEP_ID=MMETSP0113_2-20130426/27596_1 /TAXON_ID=91329 /ORGANISM="Norrisiella sphaerica, Strain BC52" /LENGTH=175 /DNA_ID=CAMNT_0026879563 /DNA_START=141 /DNA_END=665 /DNA_ORIENTATION=-
MKSDTKDLQEHIDPKNWECLNALKDHQLPNALLKGRDDEKQILKSDSDEQLLIRINFDAFVKIKAIKITAPADCGPSSIKLFVNPGSLDFEGAEDEEGTQTIELSKDDLKKDAKALPVKFVKFQKVSTLVIFVQGNQEEEDQTVIQSIQLIGKSSIIEGSKPSLAQQKAAAQGDW